MANKQQRDETLAKIAILQAEIKERDQGKARTQGVWRDPMGEIVMFGNVSKNEGEK